MKRNDELLLAAIQRQSREVLREAIGRDASDVILLDFPRHKNAGDALIYSGERSHLASLGLNRTYTVDIGRYDLARLRRAPSDSVVLFHGGGNLGDVWPEYQEFREAVIPALHGRKIVVLAQSTMFTDPEKAKRANRAFANHGEVTVLLRDHASMERAETYLPDVRTVFCPDMAFGNDPMNRIGDARHRVLFLSRTDKEKADEISEQSRDSAPVRTTDWESGMSGIDQLKWGALKIPGIVHKRVPATRTHLDGHLAKSLESMCDLNLHSARKIISQGSVLVTDRLHAHVFALLMDIPHVVLDNNYGKISSVFDAYSGQFSTANMADSIEGGLAKADGLYGTLLESAA